MYDSNNIFAKIITGEIPAKKIYEDNYVIAINDINPVAPIHILVIPKNGYKDFTTFIGNASNEEITHYYKAIKKIADDAGAKDYRVITNNGKGAGQSVFHFHSHIIGGREITGLIDKGL